MESSPKQFELLCSDLVEWISRNKLWDDTVLRLMDEYGSDEENPSACLRYFMIKSEGDLSNVISGYEIEEKGRASKLHAEFRALIESHGFWFEPYDNIVTNIYPND